MEFLRFLENLRVPGLNEFMLAVTYLGDEFIFIVVALAAYWCISKKLACYILSVGAVGIVANQFLKLWFRVPRPWILDENFTILEQAKEAASGYSFPSGHTQSSVGTFSAIAYVTKNRTVRWIAIAAAVLVPFSRMYLGVHTPADVLTSAGIALLLVFLLRPLFEDCYQKAFPYLLGFITLIASAYLTFTEFYPFPGDTDLQNLASGRENGYMLAGGIAGFVLSYILDCKKTHFPVQAVWWAQILKLVLGAALAFSAFEILDKPLHVAFGSDLGSAGQCLTVVIVAGALWPMTFSWFSGLGKKNDSF